MTDSVAVHLYIQMSEKSPDKSLQTFNVHQFTIQQCWLQNITIHFVATCCIIYYTLSCCTRSSSKSNRNCAWCWTSCGHCSLQYEKKENTTASLHLYDCGKQVIFVHKPQKSCGVCGFTSSNQIVICIWKIYYNIIFFKKNNHQIHLKWGKLGNGNYSLKNIQLAALLKLHFHCTHTSK